MIEFVDGKRIVYRFHRAWFSAGEGRVLPPHSRGCYMLLDPDVDVASGGGTHTVLYAGQAPDLSHRMITHAMNP